MIAGVFNKDKSIQYVYYSKDKDIYVIKGEDKAKDLTQTDIENYLTDLNKQMRDAVKIQTILDECKFTGSIKKDTSGKYEHNFYMESKKGYYMNGYFKDNKLVKLVFASDLYSTADKLFVYEDGKVTKDDGWVSYSGFLYNYNITSEEFINYFTTLYEQDTKK